MLDGSSIRKAVGRAGQALAVAAVLALGGSAAAGCSLGNVHHEDCTSDAQCAMAFGGGSTCQQGFCSDAPGCKTGHDCRKIGGGACVSGGCVSKFPTDATCQKIVEPAKLFDSPLTGADAPLVIGAIFSLDEPNDTGIATAVQLAVREINEKGGLNNGKKLGLVVCDNGGPGDKAMGDDRIPLNNHALDYLAGTLGAPLVVGPLSSSDSIRLINRLKQQAYPTVIISPSATSPDLTDVDDRLHPTDPYGLFWRTCPSDKLQGKVLAQVIGQITPAVGRVGVVYLHDAYGEGLATVFRTTYGLDQTDAFPYETADLDNPTTLGSIADQAGAAGDGALVVIALHGDSAVKIVTAAAGKPIGGKPFFFTDGSKDATALLDPTLPMAVKTIIAGAHGTAPASPSGPNYDLFKTNLKAQFMLDASTFSFLAQGYDAAYVGVYGIVWASKSGNNYDGLNVADGLSRLSMGTPVNIAPTEWLKGKGNLTMQGNIDVEGASGHLQFDPKTGEAPGKIEIWNVSADGKSLESPTVIDPT